MQEGIEPTISTIPLGCNNKIVSGDLPSTVSGDQTWHTISFSSKKGEFHVTILQDIHQAAAEGPASFDSFLILNS